MRVRSATIRMQNFQPFGDAEIQATGFTVICGENNVGKTSVFRAVDSVVNNSRHGDKDIRWGESKALVGLDLEFSDGTAVSVVREKQATKGAKYLLDGEPYEAVGRTPVADVQERLCMDSLQTRNENYPLNFQRSREMFAVDFSSTKLFDLVNELMPQKEIVTVLSSMKTDAQALKKDAEASDKQAGIEREEAERLEATVEKLSAPDGGEDYREGLRDEVGSYTQQVGTLERAVTAQETADRAVVRTRGLVQLSIGVPEMSVSAEEYLSETKTLVEALAKARTADAESRKLTGVCAGLAERLSRALEAVAAAVIDKDPSEAMVAVKTAVVAQERAERLGTANVRLESLLEKAQTAAETAGSVFAEAEQVIRPVQEAMEKHNWAIRLRQEDIQQMEALAAEAKEIEANIEALRAEEALCPTCGAPVDENGKYSR